MIRILIITFKGLLNFLGFSINTGSKLVSGLVPILVNFVKKCFKILFFTAFLILFLNFTTTLIAFLLYHINLTIGVALSNYTTSFTVSLLSYYVLGIILLITGKLFYKLIAN